MNDVFLPELSHHGIQKELLTAFRNDKLPHALLFHGPEGCGKDVLALGLAQLLNCGDSEGVIDRSSAVFQRIAALQHPDVQVIFPTPAKTNLKEEDLQEARRQKAENPYKPAPFPNQNVFIGIETIRELKREAGYKLFEGRRKVFIFSEADQMRPEAANALLKLLEEPPDNLVLVLTTANVRRILPTIKSRCRLIRFAPLGETEIKTVVLHHLPSAKPKELGNYIRLSGFNIRRTFEFLENDVLTLRDQAIELLRKIVLIKRTQELLQLIEPLAARRDRRDARRLLWFLLLWFQDILHLKNLPKAEVRLHNADREDNLKKFIAFTPNADIPGIVREIETAIQSLDNPRNFNPLLILTTLAIKLNRKIKKNNDL